MANKKNERFNDIKVNEDSESENNDYTILGKTNKHFNDEGRSEICERATLYFNKDLYREFRYIAGKRPNRVLEDFMREYIKTHKH